MTPTLFEAGPWQPTRDHTCIVESPSTYVGDVQLSLQLLTTGAEAVPKALT